MDDLHLLIKILMAITDGCSIIKMEEVVPSLMEMLHMDPKPMLLELLKERVPAEHVYILTIVVHEKTIKIEPVKIVREITGLGLKEAKDIVDVAILRKEPIRLRVKSELMARGAVEILKDRDVESNFHRA